MFIFERPITVVLHLRKNLQSRALREMGKKGKVVASEKTEMNPLFKDTTCSREGGTSTWEAMYNILEEEEPRIMETKVTVDGHDSSDASMLETTCSFLYCIAARSKIIPYTNMVNGLSMKPKSQTENSRQEAKGLWDLFPWTTYGLCITYQSHKSSTTGNSWRSLPKRTMTQ